MLKHPREQSQSENIFMQGIHWLADHTIRKILPTIAKSFSLKSHTKIAQKSDEMLSFPYLRQNPKVARRYGMTAVRQKMSRICKYETHKNENNCHNEKRERNENNVNEGASTSFHQQNVNGYWGEAIKVYIRPMQLVCPICMDFYVEAVTTQCGHTFCYECVDEAILLNANCPVCRSNIRGNDIIVTRELNAIILNYLKKFTQSTLPRKDSSDLSFDSSSQRQLSTSPHRTPQSSEKFSLNQLNPITKSSYHSSPNVYYDSYLKRKQQFTEWTFCRSIKKHKINVSDLLDIRDTELIWCKAIIKKIFVKGDDSRWSESKRLRIESILIHYIGWSNIYDEIIPISSNRLAEYRFYTSRKDIPYYDLCEDNQDHVHSYVVVEEPLHVEIVDENMQHSDENMQQSESDEDENIMHHLPNTFQSSHHHITFDFHFSHGTNGNQQKLFEKESFVIYNQAKVQEEKEVSKQIKYSKQQKQVQLNQLTFAQTSNVENNFDESEVSSDNFHFNPENLAFNQQLIEERDDKFEDEGLVTNLQNIIEK